MAHAPPEQWPEQFRAWVWKPPYLSWRVRGMFNATLRIHPGRFTVRSRFRSASVGWPEIEYSWPAVVIQTLRPVSQPAVLFEMNGKLASCSVWFEGKRLRTALASGGFAIIEVKRLGWERPHRVSRELLGKYAGDVPSALWA